MGEKIQNKRQQKANETRKKIYESARRLFLEHGADNVSVDSIVASAGVSKGAFYVHYESKDTLIAAFVNEYTSQADNDYKSYLDTISEHKSVFDILTLLAGEIVNFIETNIGSENMRILYKAHLTKTVNTTSAMSYQRDLYHILIEVLDKGVNQGELREDIPVDSLAKHLVIAIRGITFEWCIRYPDIALKEQVLDHFKILLYGIKK